MSDMQDLSKRFAHQSSEAQKEADWLELDARLNARAAAKSGSVSMARRPRAALTAAALLAAAAAAVLTLRATQMQGTAQAGTAAGPLHTQSGQSLQTQLFDSPSVRTLTLDDGSELQPQGSAHLQLRGNDGAHFELVQRSGAVHYKVTPGGPRRWSIDAALARVEVVGTEFTVSVSVSDTQLRVNVDHGIVRVTGDAVPDHERLLTAGESLVVRAPGTAPPTEAIVQAPSLPAPKTMHNTPTLDAPANESERARARDTILLRARADELWALADASRAGGHAREAVPALERLVQMHPEDVRAPLAAFTLGRIYQDTLHAAPDALRAFDKALALGLPANLQEDALFHRAELLCAEPDSAACSAAQRALVGAFPGAQKRLQTVAAP